MFLLETTHQEILASNNERNNKTLDSYIEKLEELKVKQARELETAKYNYDTKLARAESEKRDAVSYNDQRNKEAISKLKNDHVIQISLLEGQYE